MAKVMMKGNEAMALAALKGGCKAFFGYPITPQSELPEYLAKHIEEYDGVFVQAESEVAAINMVYGAAGTGTRVLTSSSSPGIALKQEGITYIAGAELPCLIINVMRGGPGLGGIQPSQADYNQVTRGGGNGDYNVIAYGPENLQETCDIIKESYIIAEKYRNPVMIAVDGLIGQMMEPVDIDKAINNDFKADLSWTTTGTKGQRKPNIVSSLFLDPYDLEKHSLKLKEKYEVIKDNEQRYELIDVEDAEVVIVAYGSMARICRSAMKILRDEDIKVGMIRPITLWPFPEKAFGEIPESVKGLICIEMSTGQMLDDVKIVNNGRLPIDFFGRTGGVVPEPEEVVEAVKQMVRGLK